MQTKFQNKSRAACAAQHFGVWCVEPNWHQQMSAAVKSGLYKPQVIDAMMPPLKYDIIQGTAVIPVDDMLTKGKSSFGGTSMMELAGVLRDADRDSNVTDVLMEIDSPGGTYIGIEAVMVALASMKKTVTAKISDWAASGGLWVASGADKIIANRNARIGSIGTYTVLLDSSKADEQAGFNYILISSAELKGAGADGRISPVLIEEQRINIARITEQFISAIAENRGLTIDQVKAIADGRMFTADEALRLGLIDRVIDEVDAETFLLQEQAMTREEFIAHASQHPDDLKEAAKGLISTEVQTALTAAQPKPATLAELETAFPNDATFVLSQLKASATLSDAKLAAAAKAATDLAAAQSEISTLKAEVAKLDPAQAGLTGPLKIDDQKNGDQVITEQRRNQLRSMAGIPAKK